MSDMNSQNPHPWEQEYRVLEFLAGLSYRSGEIGSYLHEIVSGVSRLIESDWSIVTFCQDETGEIVASSLGLSQGDNSLLMHGSLVGEVTQTGQTLFIEDARQESMRSKPPAEYLGYLGVPLRAVHGECIGTICSFFRQPRQFTTEEILTVELFAERAATAIDNYRLYQQQQKFNELLEREVAIRAEELRAAQARLVERERLAAIGEFAATIVHEVRNPLTTILMGLNYAQKALPSAPARERLSLSLDESYRLERLLNEILLYAKPQVLQLSRLNVGEFLRELISQTHELPEAVGRHIVLMNDSPEIEVLADRDKLKQVFINLFRNACEAIAVGDGVRCEVVRCANPQYICINVHNGGEPIPPEILPKLTEPFCSTKPSGTGLGLAIVKRIVNAHAGELSIQSVATGTKVSVQLPVVTP